MMHNKNQGEQKKRLVATKVSSEPPYDPRDANFYVILGLMIVLLGFVTIAVSC